MHAFITTSEASHQEQALAHSAYTAPAAALPPSSSSARLPLSAPPMSAPRDHGWSLNDIMWCPNTLVRATRHAPRAARRGVRRARCGRARFCADAAPLKPTKTKLGACVQAAQQLPPGAPPALADDDDAVLFPALLPPPAAAARAKRPPRSGLLAPPSRQRSTPPAAAATAGVGAVSSCRVPGCMQAVSCHYYKRLRRARSRHARAANTRAHVTRVRPSLTRHAPFPPARATSRQAVSGARARHGGVVRGRAVPLLPLVRPVRRAFRVPFRPLTCPRSERLPECPLRRCAHAPCTPA
jgi:hypothetical protein